MRSASSPRTRVRIRLILCLYLAAAFLCALWPAAWLLRLASRDDVVGEWPERLPASRLFAVVVPISHAAELVTLRANFRYWRPGRETGGAAPCLFSVGQNSFASSRLEHRPDLVVLSSRPLNTSVRDRITEEFSLAPFCRNCFRSIRFLDCNLKPEHDIYAMSMAGTISSPYNGPLLTFLCMIGHPELWSSYHAAFLMELDAVPLQNSWLAEVELEARNLAREQRLGIQSGCPLTADKTRLSWRNGSPAIYRLGQEAMQFYLRCFHSFFCTPTIEQACTFPWDSYLAACRRRSEEVTSLFGTSCRFVHVGSTWHMRRSSKSLWEVLSPDALHRAVFIHSAKVIREIDRVVTQLERQIMSEDIAAANISRTPSIREDRGRARRA